MPSSSSLLVLSLLATASAFVACSSSDAAGGSVPGAEDAGQGPKDPSDAAPPLTSDAGSDAAPAPGYTCTTVDTPVSLLLLSVWAASDDDVWIGTNGYASLSSSVLLHWNGTAFQEFSTGTAADILDISGTSASDVWFVGANSSSKTLLHWNGTAVVPVEPVPPSYGSTIANGYSGVWANGPSDVWVVGDQNLVHFDGTTWAKPPTPTVSLEIFHGTAVAGNGADQVLFPQQSSSGYVWNGTAITSGPGTMPSLTMLDRGATGSYWGYDANAAAVKTSADGAAWTTAATFDAKTEASPTALAVAADGSPWIGTNALPIPGGYDGPYLEHLENGGAWSKTQLPQALRTVRAIATTPNSVWAVGNGGVAVRCARP